MPGSGSALPRPAVRWSLAIAITGLLTVVSAPGDGLPPLAMCAGIVVAAAALLPARAAALVAVGGLLVMILGGKAGPGVQDEDLQVLRSGHSQVFVTRMGPRGRRRTLMATKFPLPRGDDGERVVGMVALDVTAHRQRDRIMRLTFDLSPVPMARLSVEQGRLGHILDANEALGDLLGRTPGVKSGGVVYEPSGS